MWQNSKTQNVTKLKNSKCDKTEKKISKFEEEKNLTTQIKKKKVKKKNVTNLVILNSEEKNLKTKILV